MNLASVLDNPDLGAESLTLARSSETVNGRGRAVLSETQSTFSGIVTQDAGAIQERLDDGAYVTGSVMVTTATPLEIGDVIIWNAARYNVTKLGNYLRHGFNWAVCNPDGV
jgi:hypothetical protein